MFTHQSLKSLQLEGSYILDTYYTSFSVFSCNCIIFYSMVSHLDIALLTVCFKCITISIVTTITCFDFGKILWEMYIDNVSHRYYFSIYLIICDIILHLNLLFIYYKTCISKTIVIFHTQCQTTIKFISQNTNHVADIILTFYCMYIYACVFFFLYSWLKVCIFCAVISPWITWKSELLSREVHCDLWKLRNWSKLCRGLWP